MRAKHLSSAYDLAIEECENDLRRQEEALERFSEHEEVVLWFEHDLFCQIHLVYLLNWFAQRERGPTKLSLICIGAFPGIKEFRGLGELSGEQMMSLFGKRHEVTVAELDLGSTSWAAYSSPDPRDLVTLLASDTSALPFLGAALQKHLARFPSLRNGLGQIENRALNLIAGGAAQFGPLFEAFGKAEPIYGLGDAQFMLLLRQLAKGQLPLLTIVNGDGATLASHSDFSKTSFTLTRHGDSVLRGEDDYVAQNGIEAWLGGVNLAGPDPQWRWDEERSQLVSQNRLR
ncbi:MAG: hypothetical protein QOD75_1108 [Blastocatellia bacterium]|nr:hypothetical protein [Blastocatellia bacterium]